MNYIDHARVKKKCFEALQEHERIIDERKALFDRTQPQGISADRDRVSGGESVNAFDNYLIEKEKARIEEREAEAKATVNSCFALLRQIEKELAASRDIFDQIYRLNKIEKLTPAMIARRVPYSRSQVWRKLRIINETIKEDNK